MKTPTQIELATLAANMTGAPLDRARSALALWKACGEALTEEAARDALLAASKETALAAQARFAEADRFTIDEFLRIVMPQSKTEDRMRKFRQWTSHSIGFHEKLTGADLDAATERAISRDRENGIAQDIAVCMAESFEKFLTNDRKAGYAARGKKGAAGKKNALEAKKSLDAGKAPKKRAKQSVSRRK